MQVLGLPADTIVVSGYRSDQLDLVLFFAPSVAALKIGFTRHARRLVPEGMLWVAWPKKASGVPTDLSGQGDSPPAGPGILPRTSSGEALAFIPWSPVVYRVALEVSCPNGPLTGRRWWVPR